MSTWAIMRHLPATKIAYTLCIGAIGIGNISTFALYRFSDRLFEEWIGWFGPTMESMSRFLPTLRGLPEHTEKFLTSRDIDFLKSVVAFDWLLLAPCFFILFVCIFLDFRRHSRDVSRGLWAEFRAHNLSSHWANWPRVCGLGAFSVVSVAFFYSGAELGGANEIYDPTWLFLLSWLFAYGSIISPSLTFTYSMLLLANPQRAGESGPQ
jgi:hypothetical protein